MRIALHLSALVPAQLPVPSYDFMQIRQVVHAYGMAGFEFSAPARRSMPYERLHDLLVGSVVEVIGVHEVSLHVLGLRQFMRTQLELVRQFGPARIAREHALRLADVYPQATRVNIDPDDPIEPTRYGFTTDRLHALSASQQPRIIDTYHYTELGKANGANEGIYTHTRLGNVSPHLVASVHINARGRLPALRDLYEKHSGPLAADVHAAARLATVDVPIVLEAPYGYLQNMLPDRLMRALNNVLRST